MKDSIVSYWSSTVSVSIALGVYWLAARWIYIQLRTPPRRGWLDVDALSACLAWIVLIATLVCMVCLSLDIFKTFRANRKQALTEGGYPEKPGRRTTSNARIAVPLIALWALVGVIGWNYLLLQPYVRLTPEPTAMAAGEIATFTIETDIPSVGVRASRSWAVEKEGAEDCVRYPASSRHRDGTTVIVKACSTGIGVISLGGGKTQREYKAGSLPAGDEVAYFQISDSDRIPSVWDPGSFVAGETGVRVRGLDWRSGRFMLNTSHASALSLDNYVAYVYADGGRLLRRFDFADAARFDRRDAPEHVRITFSSYRYVYQWGSCEKPAEEFTGISFVEKTHAAVSDDTPRC